MELVLGADECKLPISSISIDTMAGHAAELGAKGTSDGDKPPQPVSDEGFITVIKMAKLSDQG